MTVTRWRTLGLTKSDAARLLLVFLAAAFLLLVFFLGLSLGGYSTTQDFLNANSHPVGIMVTLGFIGLGLASWFIRDSVRQRKLARDISSIGMSALVDPVLEIGLNMWHLVTRPREVVDAWVLARERKGGVSRLKWDFGQGLREESVVCVIQFPNEAWGTPGLATTANEMADQAVRRLMVSLRNWTDLLSRTTLGLEAMVAIGSLRKDLFALSQMSVPSEIPRDVAMRRYAECALRAFALALIFEACGGAEKPRMGFADCLSEWNLPGANPGEPPADGAPYGKWNCMHSLLIDDKRGSQGIDDRGLDLLSAYVRDFVGQPADGTPLLAATQDWKSAEPMMDSR